MGLLDDTIRDARQPLPDAQVPSPVLRIQRQAEAEGALEKGAEAMPEEQGPATPIEEQPDGRWLVQRFQEASAGGPAAKASVEAVGRNGSRVPLTDPPFAAAAEAQASGQRHPSDRVSANGLKPDETALSETESRDSERKTDGSHAPVRQPVRANMARKRFSPLPERDAESSSGAMNAPVAGAFRATVPQDDSLSDEARRPPGPDAPPEPRGASPQYAETSSAVVRHVNDVPPEWQKDSVAERKSMAGDSPPSASRVRKPGPGAPDVHIGFLEIQVLHDGPAAGMASPPRQKVGDTARRRYWRRW